MTFHSYKSGTVTRSAEGTYWNRIGEENGVITISIRHSTDEDIAVKKMRKCDYERLDCYPVRIPVFRPDKEF